MKKKAWMKAYYRANPHIKRAQKSKRRAMLRNAICETADYMAIREIYALSKRLERITGLKYHVDHVVPLSKGGLHHQDNLVAMRSDYNEWKGDQIIAWLIEFFTSCPVAAD